MSETPDSFIGPVSSADPWADHVVTQTRKLITGRLSVARVECYSRRAVIHLSLGREHSSPAENYANLLMTLTTSDGGQRQGWVTVFESDLYRHKEVEQAALRELRFLNTEPLTPKSWRRMAALAIEQGGNE